MDRTVCGDCGAPMELCECKPTVAELFHENKRLLAEIERLKAERDEYLWALESIQHAGRGDYNDKGQTLAEWASNALIRGAKACLC